LAFDVATGGTSGATFIRPRLPRISTIGPAFQAPAGDRIPLLVGEGPVRVTSGPASRPPGPLRIARDGSHVGRLDRGGGGG
jgi:hypothetical protein